MVRELKARGCTFGSNIQSITGVLHVGLLYIFDDCGEQKDAKHAKEKTSKYEHFFISKVIGLLFLVISSYYLLSYLANMLGLSLLKLCRLHAQIC